MRVGWSSPDPYPTRRRIGPLGWLRVGLRGVPLVVLVFGGLAILLMMRLIERPIYGDRRPWTPHVVQWVCRGALRILRIRLHREGKIMRHKGAFVANHSSWLDIFVLNACARVYFVSKAEVANWVGIGWLARATGTVFIERKREQAAKQREILARRLDMGHALMIFPEGTSSDGLRVLPFKSTLFEALYSVKAEDLWVQPVTVSYHAPAQADARFYGWWGDMDFAPHLLDILAAGRAGAVDVVFHEPLAISAYANRKDLAKWAGAVVADSLKVGAVDAP